MNEQSRAKPLFAGAALLWGLAVAASAGAEEQLTWGYATAQVGTCVAGLTCGTPGGVRVLGREISIETDAPESGASIYASDYAPVADFGRSWALAAAGEGALALPVLKAYAFGTNPIPGPNPTIAVNYALAIAVQGYTNSGEVPLAIPLNAFSGLVDYISSPGFGRLSASLAVTTGAILDPAVAALWSQAATDAPGSFGRFAADCGTTGALAIGNPAVRTTSVPGVQYLGVTTASCTGQADHVLNPGETFYVWSRLGVLRSGGGVTDAGSTFNVTITPTALPAIEALLPSLAAASGADLYIPTDAVPEPSTWAMLILGFGAAGSMLRRRRRDASVGVSA